MQCRLCHCADRGRKIRRLNKQAKVHHKEWSRKSCLRRAGALCKDAEGWELLRSFASRASTSARTSNSLGAILYERLTGSRALTDPHHLSARNRSRDLRDRREQTRYRSSGYILRQAGPLAAECDRTVDRARRKFPQHQSDRSRAMEQVSIS
jgi:hypothetical protein